MEDMSKHVGRLGPEGRFGRLGLWVVLELRVLFRVPFFIRVEYYILDQEGMLVLQNDPHVQNFGLQGWLFTLSYDHVHCNTLKVVVPN